MLDLVLPLTSIVTSTTGRFVGWKSEKGIAPKRGHNAGLDVKPLAYNCGRDAAATPSWHKRQITRPSVMLTRWWITMKEVCATLNAPHLTRLGIR
jgi:hypothetical protein